MPTNGTMAVSSCKIAKESARLGNGCPVRNDTLRRASLYPFHLSGSLGGCPTPEDGPGWDMDEPKVLNSYHRRVFCTDTVPMSTNFEEKVLVPFPGTLNRCSIDLSIAES